MEEDTIIKVAQKDVNGYIEVQEGGETKAKGGYLVKGIAPAGAFIPFKLINGGYAIKAYPPQ